MITVTGLLVSCGGGGGEGAGGEQPSSDAGSLAGVRSEAAKSITKISWPGGQAPDAQQLTAAQEPAATYERGYGTMLVGIAEQCALLLDWLATTDEAVRSRDVDRLTTTFKAQPDMEKSVAGLRLGDGSFARSFVGANDCAKFLGR